jgi:hypothetical protein
MTWLDTAEAARSAHRALRTTQEAAASGELHGFQRTAPNGKWLFDEACVDAWVMGVPCPHRSNLHVLKAKAS